MYNVLFDYIRYDGRLFGGDERRRGNGVRASDGKAKYVYTSEQPPRAPTRHNTQSRTSQRDIYTAHGDGHGPAQARPITPYSSVGTGSAAVWLCYACVCSGDTQRKTAQPSQRVCIYCCIDLFIAIVVMDVA